jgi:hypothetical protein
MPCYEGIWPARSPYMPLAGDLSRRRAEALLRASSTGEGRTTEKDAGVGARLSRFALSSMAEAFEDLEVTGIRALRAFIED